MTRQDDTLAQLNAARDELTTFIIQNTATQGTPEWTQLEEVIDERDQLTLLINDVLEAAFPGSTPALDDAIATLKARTIKLQNLAKTMGQIGAIATVADAIVQIAGSILEAIGT